MSGEVPADAPGQLLTVRRKLPCRQEEAFAAWTDPDALVAWFGGTVAKTLSAAVEPYVGGSYRVTMQRDDEVGAVEGVYLEVEPPQRLVFTWRWDRAEIEDGRESIVTVEFLGHRDATEVVVTHEGIRTEASFAFHVGGWRFVMERLEGYLTRSPS